MFGCVQRENLSSRLIVLESRNDSDISQAELDELARAIRVALEDAGESDVDVRAVAQPAPGVGSQWADVLHLFLPSKDFIKDAVWTAVIAHAEELMRRRFSRKHEACRPRLIVVRESENGEVLGIRELTDADGDFAERDGASDEKRLPPPLS
jgi:hypothetical protein